VAQRLRDDGLAPAMPWGKAWRMASSRRRRALSHASDRQLADVAEVVDEARQ